MSPGCSIQSRLAMVSTLCLLAIPGTAMAIDPPRDFAIASLAITYIEWAPGPRLDGSLCSGDPSRSVLRLDGLGVLTMFDEYDIAVCEASRRSVQLDPAIALEVLNQLVNSGFFHMSGEVSGMTSFVRSGDTATRRLEIGPHSTFHRVVCRHRRLSARGEMHVRCTCAMLTWFR